MNRNYYFSKQEAEDTANSLFGMVIGLQENADNISEIDPDTMLNVFSKMAILYVICAKKIVYDFNHHLYYMIVNNDDLFEEVEQNMLNYAKVFVSALETDDLDIFLNVCEGDVKGNARRMFRYVIDNNDEDDYTNDEELSEDDAFDMDSYENYHDSNGKPFTTEHLRFMDIPITGNYKSFVRKLQNKGFKKHELYDEDFISLVGNFATFPAEVDVETDNLNRIDNVYEVKVRLSFSTPQECNEAFAKLSKSLKKKYPNHQNLVNFIELPEGDIDILKTFSYLKLGDLRAMGFDSSELSEDAQRGFGIKIPMSVYDSVTKYGEKNYQIVLTYSDNLGVYWLGHGDDHDDDDIYADL